MTHRFFGIMLAFLFVFGCLNGKSVNAEQYNDDEGYEIIDYSSDDFYDLSIAPEEAVPLEDIIIVLDAYEKNYSVDPLEIDGQIYVPLKDIFEDCGGTVNYYSEDDAVCAVRNGCSVYISLKNRRATVNGEPYENERAYILYNNRTLVSVDFLNGRFGMTAAYDKYKKKVFIGTNYKIDKALSEYCSILRDMWVWQVNLYDPLTGGFYPTRSLAETTGEVPTIQATAQALSVFTYLECTDSVPEDIKNNIIKYIQNCQDPDTGYFIDNEKTASSDREKGRALSFAQQALKQLGAKALYPLPAERGNDREEESPLPEYMQTTEAFRKYMEELPWDGQPWSAGDQIAAAVMLLAGMDEDLKKEYYHTVFDFCREKQNPSDGMWGGNDTPFRVISGAFKIACVYRDYSEKIPNPEAIYDTTISAMRNDEGIDACFVRNPVDLFGYLVEVSPAVKEKVNKDIEEIIRISIQNTKKLQMEGGGCIKSLVYGADPTGLMEGDLNAAAAMRIASGYLHTLAGRKKDYCEDLVPKLFEIMRRKNSAAEYLNENFENVKWKKDDKLYPVFSEKFDITYKMYQKGGTVETVNDPGNASNSVLVLDDNSEKSEISYKVSGFETNVARKTSIEYRIMFEKFRNGDLNLFSQKIGSLPILNLIVREKGKKLYLGIRQRDGDIESESLKLEIDEKEWYTVKVVLTSSDLLLTNVEYYVNGKKIDELQRFYDSRDSIMLSFVDEISFESTAQTIGKCYIDDIKICQSE